MGDSLAILSDIHGNSWALDAVLEDLRRHSVTGILDLGDSLFGPLDPAGTAERLLELEIPSLRGNQDRVLVHPPAEVLDHPTFRFTQSQLTGRVREWLAALPVHRTYEDLFLCHAQPAADDVYLMEQVGEHGVSTRSTRDIQADLAGISGKVVLCGHSHVPRSLWVEGTWIVNPGSVGLPAYSNETPWPHEMESGSPHARYAMLTRTGAGWRVEHIAVPYDWNAAAEAALRNGRPDWARWIATGRAERV